MWKYRTFWIKSRLSYECKNAEVESLLKSGTIMENSNLSFSFGIKLCFDERYQERVFLQKKTKTIDERDMEPVWVMVHKLRKYGNRDAKTLWKE